MLPQTGQARLQQRYLLPAHLFLYVCVKFIRIFKYLGNIVLEGFYSLVVSVLALLLISLKTSPTTCITVIGLAP